MNRITKNIFTSVFAVLLIIGVTVSMAYASPAKKIHIGAAHRGLNDDHSVAQDVAMKAACDKLGIEYTLLDAQESVDRQNAQINDLIAMKCDAIIVFPIDSKAILPAIQKIKKAGIVNIGLDSAYMGADLYISFDNERGAERAAEFLVEKLTEKNGDAVGRLLTVIGPLKYEVHATRAKGFQNIMAKYPKIDVVFKTVNNNDEAFALVQNTANVYGDKLDGIFLSSDGFFPGVFSALDKAGRRFKTGNAKHVFTASIDAQPIAIQSIREGYMDASVAQYPDEYGQLAIEWALKLLKGEKPVMGTTVNDPGKPWSPMEFVNLPTGPALLLKPAVVPIEVSTYDEVLYSVRAFEAKKK